ncbi:hypothetical protein VC83_03831 [Pseudogymnoascus destructans]|uniref:Uncharacterized protein n=1 Tax=Pseudogymnoascus destructans TaxID=655981 RepID=A0A177ACF2_9PEZI|nr:uncharacterized protein VC83_03831 [Pseudogymnoascus destructans]OAF59785.1 hypothetical protein VC83_03831 [Pseudogymnoascus destructans]
MKTADGGVHALDKYVLLLVKVAGVEWILKVFIIHGLTSYKILLGRSWMHQVKAVGDYSSNDYYIFGTNGQPRSVLKNGDVTPQISLKVHFERDEACTQPLNERQAPDSDTHHVKTQTWEHEPEEVIQARLTNLADQLATAVLLESTHLDYDDEDPRMLQSSKILETCREKA